MTTETRQKVVRTTFEGVPLARIHDGTLQGGVKAILDFTVSVGQAEKLAGEFHQVKGLVVEFDGTLVQNLLANAMANQKVAWAPSLRENPERVSELSGKVVRFGEPLFADLTKVKRVTVARPPTAEEVATYIKTLPRTVQLEKIIEVMKSGGMDTSLVEAELEALKQVEV